MILLDQATVASPMRAALTVASFFAESARRQPHQG